jgi:predicted transcriptional regulator
VRGLGELEAGVMDRLWEWRTATVRDVLEDLQKDRGIAYTTVMTVMDNLHTKGWLARERDGKAWRYTPTASRAEFSARLMREALEGGEAEQGAVFSHFLAQISEEEAQALRAALRRMGRGRSK